MKADYNVPRIKDKIRIYEKSGRETATFFLNPLEMSEILPILRGQEFTFGGGFEGAERCIVVLGNDDANLWDYLAVIEIQSNGKILSHRSVLGSILGLGIKREMIGDILVKDTISNIVVMCEMKAFILSHFQKVGNDSIKIKEIKPDEMISLDDKKKDMTVSVASLRIDAMISAVWGMSREKSVILIEQEKVFLNFLECKNHAKVIKARRFDFGSRLRTCQNIECCSAKREKEEYV